MSKDKLTDYSATAADNADIGGISIVEGCNFGNMNNAVRESMSHLAEAVAGTYPVFDTWTWSDPSDTTKRFRFDGGSIGSSQTRVITVPNKDLTLVSADSPTFTDTSDATKQITFALSGITTSTTRTVTWPDADVTIPSGTITTTASTITETAAWYIQYPTEKSYKVVVKAAFDGTITEVTTISESGTCTATVKINTTALGGTANSVSTSEQSQAHSTNNSFSAGDDLVITISSNSSCVGLSLGIKYTRALA